MPKKCSFLATQEVKGRGNSNQLLDKVDHLSKLSSVLSTLTTQAVTTQAASANHVDLDSSMINGGLARVMVDGDEPSINFLILIISFDE